MRFGGFQVGAAFAGFADQGFDLLVKTGVGQGVGNLDQPERLIGVQPHEIGQGAERVFQRSLGLDAFECGL